MAAVSEAKNNSGGPSSYSDSCEAVSAVVFEYIHPSCLRRRASQIALIQEQKVRSGTIRRPYYTLSVSRAVQQLLRNQLTVDNLEACAPFGALCDADIPIVGFNNLLNYAQPKPCPIVAR